MMKVLANDGIHATGKRMLEEAGFTVETNKIAQDDLMTELNNYDVIIVRSATTVRKDLIDNTPNLKVICRAGVGMDNIDVEYARNKGLHVVNTPSASSRSVAELVFSHFLSLSRGLHLANREMPERGEAEFKVLKKSYSKGQELKGKTLGVIGLGRIGCETIKIGVGMEMQVLGHDPYVSERDLTLNILGEEVAVKIKGTSLDEVLSKSDYISLHVPYLGKAILGSSEFDNMKDNVIIVNAARGGVVDESALLDALQNSKIRAAGLDVFVGEPSPNPNLLSQNNISLSPHIGASTSDAQENIGKELADQIISILK